jgi:hypothetical protein
MQKIGKCSFLIAANVSSAVVYCRFAMLFTGCAECCANTLFTCFKYPENGWAVRITDRTIATSIA